MIPISEEEAKNMDLSSYQLTIPEHLADSLIGEPIEGTSYFKSFPEDPTSSGFVLLYAGTPLENRMYKTLHTPTGSQVQYRKLNSLVWGDVWEAVPK